MSSARAFFDACAVRGVRLDLAPMRALAAALAEPQRACPTLLVAGTNGKGSVCAYVEAALRASRLRTGRFTSPALVRVEEQIALDGEPIAPAALDAALDDVRLAAARAGVEPSAFEALAAAACVHFRRARVDVAVLEVGLGGADDATNVADPLVSSIVTLARDHERFLGHGLEQIARAKAGVMRAGRVTVVGPLPPEARRVVGERAAALGAHLLDALAGVRLEEAGDALSVTSPARVYRGLRPLPGAHQRDNLIVALRLLEAAHEAGLRVDFDALPSALAGVRWPGRLQSIDGRPPLLLDGAHNPAAAQALGAHLRGRGPFVLLFGAMADKDLAGMAAALFPPARAVVLTRADDSPRAAAPEALAALAGGCAREVALEPDRQRALALARRLALEPSAAGAAVVVAGSLALVGTVLARLGSEAE
jgi:dihydrofolate synthase/folylpolyglutamate synthase